MTPKKCLVKGCNKPVAESSQWFCVEHAMPKQVALKGKE